MEKLVFTLMHSHEMSLDREDIKLIGVYSSAAAATSAAYAIGAPDEANYSPTPIPPTLLDVPAP